MDSPSPSPPWLRLTEESALRKRSKRCGRKAGSIPCPVSRTSIRANDPSRTARIRTSPPSGVYLTAFVRRFQTIAAAGWDGDDRSRRVEILPGDVLASAA
jgi:hypothetical protein